jgi:hypothetical protein
MIMKDREAADLAKKVIEAKIGRGGVMFRNEQQSELCSVASEDGEATFVADHINSVRVVDADMWEKLRHQEHERYTAELRALDHKFINEFIKAREPETTDRADG